MDSGGEKEMRLQRVREELRRRFDRLRAKTSSNPDSKQLNRIDFLDLLITVLKDHEKSLDELIDKASLAMETQTKRLEDLLFRLEEVLSR